MLHSLIHHITRSDKDIHYGNSDEKDNYSENAAHSCYVI